MSTKNIIAVTPAVGAVAVDVTFKVHGRDETRTYRYFTLEAIRGILAGEDPSQWSGELVDSGTSGGSGLAGGLEDIADIGEAISEL